MSGFHVTSKYFESNFNYLSFLQTISYDNMNWSKYVKEKKEHVFQTFVCKTLAIHSAISLNLFFMMLLGEQVNPKVSPSFLTYDV